MIVWHVRLGLEISGIDTGNELFEESGGDGSLRSLPPRQLENLSSLPLLDPGPGEAPEDGLGDPLEVLEVNRDDTN